MLPIFGFRGEIYQKKILHMYYLVFLWYCCGNLCKLAVTHTDNSLNFTLVQLSYNAKQNLLGNLDYRLVIVTIVDWVSNLFKRLDHKVLKYGLPTLWWARQCRACVSSVNEFSECGWLGDTEDNADRRGYLFLGVDERDNRHRQRCVALPFFRLGCHNARFSQIIILLQKLIWRRFMLELLLQTSSSDALGWVQEFVRQLSACMLSVSSSPCGPKIFR